MDILWGMDESEKLKLKREKEQKNLKREKAYEYSLEGCLANVVFDFEVTE